jgi:Galactosyltransferase
MYKFVVGHEPGTKYSYTSTKLLSEIKDILVPDIFVPKYKDILVPPFDDNYWNLAINVMFKWPTTVDECKVIFKIDDDVHIRASRFTAMIRN